MTGPTGSTRTGARVVLTSDGRSSIRQHLVRSGGSSAPPRRWFGLEEIADDLGVSLSTVQKWSARRPPHFPRSIRLPNGRIRVKAEWYEEWLAALEVP